ncbi:DoxX family protein [Glycomyces scopariae]
MNAFPDPLWPVLVLAFVSFGDALLCLRPVAFVAKCFEDVRFPRRWWWVAAPLKFAAAAGLVAGIWIPYLGALTAAAVVLYFLSAVAMHVRARDFGRNLFLNAAGMLALSVFTLLYSFA